MKKITLFILVIISGIIFSNCNKDDENVRTTTDSIVGTWKLIEEYTDGSLVSLNDCALQENYIFGAEQFTHELFSNSSRRFSPMGSDDDDDDDHASSDDDDHGSSDDDDDDHGSSDDDHSGTTDDDSDDDDDIPSGECIMSEQKLGFWTNNNNNYVLTIENASETMTINFIENSNKFYFEKTVIVNGITKVKRYVFQRQ